MRTVLKRGRAGRDRHAVGTLRVRTHATANAVCQCEQHRARLCIGRQILLERRGDAVALGFFGNGAHGTVIDPPRALMQIRARLFADDRLQCRAIHPRKITDRFDAVLFQLLRGCRAHAEHIPHGKRPQLLLDLLVP